jgi:hypothetical protein
MFTVLVCTVLAYAVLECLIVFIIDSKLPMIVITCINIIHEKLISYYEHSLH